MSESDNEAKVPRASVPSIAINEPLQVANYDSVYGNENSDKEPAVLDRRQSKVHIVPFVLLCDTSKNKDWCNF